jgi:hypothetical protein
VVFMGTKTHVGTSSAPEYLPRHRSGGGRIWQYPREFTRPVPAVNRATSPLPTCPVCNTRGDPTARAGLPRAESFRRRTGPRDLDARDQPMSEHVRLIRALS